MTHTVLPVLDEIAVEQQVLFRVDAVREGSCVGSGYLLVPSLPAYRLLALEGIEAVERDVQGGQSHGDAGVAHVLREVEGTRERQAYVCERLAVADGRGTCALRVALRIVHGRQVVALVAAGSEVHAGAEALGGIRLRS